MSNPYIFADTQHSPEIERLQAIEQEFDPASQRRILATGLTEGWHCLEVGAGAGSIMRWMAEKVGERGKVVAVDLNTRFIATSNLSNVEVREGDIRDLASENYAFDLIHTRYVLIHIPDFHVVLSKLLNLLKPGGWLVLEEPDFSAARPIVGDEAACQSVNRVNQAILRMFAIKGIDAALGVKLPAILQNLGLQKLSIENDTPLSVGNSGMATIMRMSTVQLAEQYLATGEATAHDIQEYCRFAENPQTWAIYYATVGITAQQAIAGHSPS